MDYFFHPLLEDAIELHVHSSPSIFPRRQTDWELIEDVRRAKMAGVVLKAHEGQTYDRATLLGEKYPDLHIYGGLVCNAFSGGLSPVVVDVAIQMGAKIIWMPTISAEQHQKFYSHRSTGKLFNSEKPLPHLSGGIRVVNDEGKLWPEVYEILYLIAEKDIVLATGHLAPYEVEVLVREAKEIGIQKILIQHVDLGIAKMSLDMQKKLVCQGCILEKCYLACGSGFHDISLRSMADSIRELGADSCVLVTDYGQAHNSPPVQALGEFIQQMMDNGISEREIEKMVSINPRELLALSS
ncbi:hypothetical protein GCM10007416_05600 [Kroppenstedtia guangzhouensis]|uniref:Cytosolic protein n=1 Tax=Kroppenstedtia guangzhouensis TaxID=1274356 RepID=A0ABQ1G1G7_9BACL|nr:DUF6282 family protein [Kroppenstedtia guangzhouensis]GGA35642.1 hypothetical protein GCM10007416_05600 [Kroppenstedtia guangzhouensis]